MGRVEESGIGSQEMRFASVAMEAAAGRIAF
jgi:hypothetical protein